MFKAFIALLLVAVSVESFAQHRPRRHGEPGGVRRRTVPGPGPVRRHPAPGPVIRRHPPVVVRRYPTRTFPGYGATVTLGDVLISGHNDSSYEQVDSCSYVYGEGRISAIKLRALNDDVTIRGVRVRFEDGGGVSLPILSGYLYNRQETLWADLPGSSRCVDSVQIVGSDNDYGRSARVQILGRVGYRRF